MLLPKAEWFSIDHKGREDMERSRSRVPLCSLDGEIANKRQSCTTLAITYNMVWLISWYTSIVWSEVDDSLEADRLSQHEENGYLRLFDVSIFWRKDGEIGIRAIALDTNVQFSRRNFGPSWPLKRPREYTIMKELLINHVETEPSIIYSKAL